MNEKPSPFGILTPSSDFGTYREVRLAAQERPIFILENVVEAETHEVIYDHLKSLGYRFTDADRADTRHIRHLMHDFGESEFESDAILSNLIAYARAFLESKNLECTGLNRAYVNFNLFGDFQYAHCDGDEWTALYFANSKWGPDDGGEFMIYGDDPDLAIAVQPKPGRMVIFDGLLLHRGGVPSKLCFEPRITLAMKFNRKEKSSGS